MINNTKDVPVSIIIPVYNVYEWLDECLESVRNQTFGNFEVLLIDDGSTDGSEKKCDEWAIKDERFHVIKCLHRGVSLCRNVGISKARGEYLLFVDADDWIDKMFVEKLYKTICETGADLVECDFWRYDNNTGKKTYRPCYGRMGIEYTTEERMLYGESTVWKYITKKQLWMKNGVEMPDCLGSAHVAYVLFLALGAKVVSIHEPLYYYRRMRKGSIIDVNGKNSKEEGKMGLAEISALLLEFNKRGLYKKYEGLLERIIKYRMSDLLAAQFSRKSLSDFSIQYNNYIEYIIEKFPAKPVNTYFIIGGYNLNRILSYLPEIQNPYYRFNFSSLVSIVNPVEGVQNYTHPNQYRSKMIEKDVKSTFWAMLEQFHPKYLFIDFVEERFDIIQVCNGYITKSDAYEEAEKKNENGIELKKESEEFKKIWEKSCICFFERVKLFLPLDNIYIIENYLSSKVGNTIAQKEYEQINTINKTNSLLREKYVFVKKNIMGIHFVESYKNQLYFTDEEYEYGAVPSHLNEIVNKIIARQIEQEMDVNREKDV